MPLYEVTLTHRIRCDEKELAVAAAQVADSAARISFGCDAVILEHNAIKCEIVEVYNGE